MIISEFESLTDTTPRHVALSWPELRKRLTTFATVSEKSGGLWAPVIYKRGGRRSLENVAAVTALCFDFDHVSGDISKLDELLAPFTYCAHTTFSCSSDNVAFRLVIPLDRPVRGSLWGGVWDRAYYWISSTAIRPDTACRDASRIFYWPQERTEGSGVAWFNDGDLLNPAILPELPPPPRVKKVYKPAGVGVVDPLRMTEGCIRRAHPGKRADLGFWLARKLRDGGVDRETAEACLLRYQQAVGDDGFTAREALNAVKQAYKRLPQGEVAHAGAL